MKKVEMKGRNSLQFRVCNNKHIFRSARKLFATAHRGNSQMSASDTTVYAKKVRRRPPEGVRISFTE